MEDNYRTKVSSGYFASILKAVAVSLIVTFIILLIAALLLCFTDFPEAYTFPSAIAAAVLGVYAGSSMAAKNNPDKSLISSLLTAFIYVVISFIIGCILEGRVSFTLNTALFNIIGLITAAIASIFAKRGKHTKSYKQGSNKFTDRFNKKSGLKRHNYN